MVLSALLHPVSFLPSMSCKSRTNPYLPRRAQVFGFPLETKYNQHRNTTRLFQSTLKLHSPTTCHPGLKPDYIEFKNKNTNHVHSFLQMASEFAEAMKKLIMLAVISAAIWFWYSYKALAASGGVMGGDSFSSYSSSSSSNSYSSSSSSSFSYPTSSTSVYSYSESSFPTSEYESSEPSLSTTSSECNYVAYTSAAPQTIPRKQFLKNVLVFSISLVFLVGFVILYYRPEEELERCSVIKLQVALEGSDRSFQRDLNRIAKLANTSTDKGLKSILTESSLALLQHSTSWASLHLSVAEKRSVQNVEKYFKRLSFEERSKFDQETLVKLDTFMKEEELITRNYDNLGHDFVVVTILVATVGIVKLPSIESREGLTASVRKLNDIAMEKILAVQVLWTPQNETDTLSSQRVLKDYPLLRPLRD